MNRLSSDATPVFDGERLCDILVTRKGRGLRMLGPAGSERELSFLPDARELFGRARHEEQAPDQSDPQTLGERPVLPVLIGSGVGAALERLAAMLEERQGPGWALAVVDKEEDILAASGLRERFASCPGIRFFPAREQGPAREDTPEECIRQLTRWQAEQGGGVLKALANPFYLRIDRDYYHAVREACEASRKADFWDRARYRKFAGDKPRILLLTSKYFLMGEIIAACKRLDIPIYLLQVPEDGIGRSDFIEGLLGSVLQFRPDFIFTINHLGVDREGVLADLLARLRLPLASWFVDNPHLILSLYHNLVSPWTALFTWDADNLESLSALGFEHVSYLPLGVDTHRFVPPGPGHSFPGLPRGWNGNVSFVGNSMVSKVSDNMEAFAFPPILLENYQEVAAAFAESEERSMRVFLKERHPALIPAFDSLPHAEARLTYETMLTWEATRQYRLSCVRGIMDLAPLIVGDEGWRSLLKGTWHYRREMNYYDDLPRFYPCSAINFNCTSKQMKGAVNQRVFDVPAAGAFVLTDYRAQMENLFEPGREVVFYNSPEEAGELAREYLAAPEKRRAVVRAARARILAGHSYEHRVGELVARMREFYG